jgi:hypothetical protein
VFRMILILREVIEGSQNFQSTRVVPSYNFNLAGKKGRVL